MTKIIKTHPLGVYDHSDRVFIVTLKWAAAVVAGSILTGAVGGAFALATIANTDHFSITTNARAIDDLRGAISTKAEKTYVDKGFEGISASLHRLEENQNTMQSDIKQLLSR